MTSWWHDEASFEITKHGGIVTLHNKESGRYYQVNEASPMLTRIEWHPYVSSISREFFHVYIFLFMFFLGADYSWFFTTRLQYVQGVAFLPLFVFVIINIFVHELAHVLSLRICGRKADSLGFKLNYGVFPSFYVRMDQLLMLSQKEKLFCHLAGLWINLGIVGVVVLLDMLNVSTDSLNASAHVFLAMLVMNMIPILNTDGQKALMTILGAQQTRNIQDESVLLHMVRAISIVFAVCIVARAAYTFALFLGFIGRG